jgi:hypothetical protein
MKSTRKKSSLKKSSSNRTAPKRKALKTKKKGEDLLNQVIKLTGIPSTTIRRELKTILDRKGLDINNLTLDQLRLVVASYLREIMGGLLDRAGHKRTETKH